MMAKTVEILLGSVDKVKNFVNVISGIEGETTITAGRYVVDAKSIMGIFSLDLSKPLCLEVEEWQDEYMKLLEPYLI